MRTFGQKQNRPHQRATSSLARSKAAIPEPIHHTHPLTYLPRTIGNRAMGQLLAGTAKAPISREQSVRRSMESNKESRRGLPKDLKAGIESLSGMAMDDVKVHYNSAKPGEVQALAHTQGSNIYLGPGQETHLPHEAWHVVQQRQGRVNPTSMQAKGASINDDAGLEREADQIAAKALQVNGAQHVQGNYSSPVSRTVKPLVIQRKKAPATDFGEFETTNFVEADGRGVEIALKFTPDESKVDAKKIALSQSLRKTTASGDAYALSPNQANKMVASGKSGAGYAIDTLPGANNPLYGERNTLGAAQDLKDTPTSANTTADPVNVGVNTNYELGHCYKEKPTDASKKSHPASLWDKPQGGKNKGESKMFETVALAIDGADKNKYYGSVTWGYKMEGTATAPTVTKIDIDRASKGTPTANFIEPAKSWNVGKTPGTIKVTADPEATVLKGDASTTEKLAKDTKLKQLETNMWESSPAIKAQVIKADGSAGKTIYIKVSDVKDIGDGSENKKLPE